MGKLKKTLVTGLTMAIGLTAGAATIPAEAVGKDCKVEVAVDRYVELEVHPEVIVSLTDCGSGSLTVDIRHDGGIRSVPADAPAVDGENNVWAGVEVPGDYEARARVDGITTGWVPFTIVEWPTAHSAGWKLTGEATNAWGSFDVKQPITVWTEVWITNRWSKSQQRTTNASGGYTIPLTYGANTAGVYQFRIAGSYPGGHVVYSDPIWLERVDRPTGYSAGLKIVGEETNAWGRFDAFQPITVWTEVWTGSSWSKSQQRTTSVDGSYAIPLTYGANSSGVTRWRVAGYVDQSTLARTAEFTLRRVAKPSASTAGTARVGANSNAWGSFDTDGERIKVWTEAWTGSGWSKSQERTTNADGGYVIPLTYRASNSGTTRWRIAGEYPEGIVRTDEVTLRRN